MTHPSARESNFYFENIGWHLYTDLFKKPILNSITKKISEIKSILTEIAEQNKLNLDFKETQLASRFGCFKFLHQNETEIPILFEFQKSFYGDLRFGLHKNKKYINGAKECCSPFDNWITLEDDFDRENFKKYFDDEIKALLPELLKSQNR